MFRSSSRRAIADALRRARAPPRAIDRALATLATPTEARASANARVARSATRFAPPSARDGERRARGFASASASNATRASANASDEARDARDDGVTVDLDAELGAPKSAKVAEIADRVCELTLIEVNELCDVLAERLGLGDMSGMMFGGGAMPAGGGSGGGGGGGGGNAAAAPAEEKTSFALKLESFDAAQKIKVIKEVRAITDLGLKEAKELVEGAPAVLKKELKKEEAEALIAKLTAVGAVAALE